MRFSRNSILFLLALMGTLMVCRNPEGPGDDEDQFVLDPRSFVGIFRDTLPANSDYDMAHPIIVGLEISEEKNPSTSSDSTFLLFAMEIPAEKYLYKHRGIWSLNNSIITLSGTTCEMIDVTTPSTKLEPQPDSISHASVQLDTLYVADGTWENIRIINLGSIVRSIPWYNTKYKDFLLSISVDLKKRVDTCSYF